MSVGDTATWTVNVSADRSQSDGLAESLSALKAKILEDTKALREMEAALKNLQKGTSVDIDTQRRLQDQITGKKAEIAANTEAYVKLGGTFSELAPAAGEAQAGMGGLLDLMAASGGQAGAMGSRIKALSQALGKAGLVGAIIVAVAVIAILVSAALIATYKLAAFALSASDAARSAGLLREAATGSAAAGQKLGTVIAEVAGRVPTLRAAIEEIALKLARSGLEGQDLAHALSAVAIAGATMGQEAGSALQGLIDKAREAGKVMLSELDLKGTGLKLEDIAGALAKRMGTTVAAAMAALKSGQVKLDEGLAALDDAMRSKYGAVAMRQMLAFGVQVDKAKENLTRLFSGVKIDGFLVALKGVLSLLDESTVSGRALKVLFESLLNPLFSGLAKTGPFVQEFFKGMLIVALMAAVGILKVKKELDGIGSSLGGIDGMKVALYAGYAVAILIGSAVAALTILLGLCAVAAALVFLPFIIAGIAVAAIIYGVISAAGALADVFSSVYDAVSSIDLGSVASDIVTGFINTITGSNGLVAAAAASLGRAALGAIKGVLGIASPSKEMGRLADFSVQGFVGRIKAGEGDVETATENLVRLPAKAPAAGQAKEAGKAQARAGGDINVTIITKDGKDAKVLSERSFLDRLTQAVETAAGMGGAMLTVEVPV